MPTTDDQTTEPQVTPGFGKKTFGGEILPLPSGAIVRVRRPGLQALLKEGIIDKFDALGGIVNNETIPVAQGRPPAISKGDAQKMLEDPKKITELMSTVDKIAINVMLEPKLYPLPIPKDADGQPKPNPSDEEVDALRNDDLSYVDYVDFEDKLFIMNFAVGGTRDLEQFRAESQAALGLLHDGEAAPDPAQ